MLGVSIREDSAKNQSYNKINKVLNKNFEFRYDIRNSSKQTPSHFSPTMLSFSERILRITNFLSFIVSIINNNRLQKDIAICKGYDGTNNN